MIKPISDEEYKQLVSKSINDLESLIFTESALTLNSIKEGIYFDSKIDAAIKELSKQYLEFATLSNVDSQIMLYAFAAAVINPEIEYEEERLVSNETEIINSDTLILMRGYSNVRKRSPQNVMAINSYLELAKMAYAQFGIEFIEKVYSNLMKKEQKK
ncbi:MAG TPA: hypothetical protein VEC16_02100 [Alphaproteobacteria bacterium]|nr:hypothetical protein [Alphaproteobacteria bacterium]